LLDACSVYSYSKANIIFEDPNAFNTASVLLFRLFQVSLVFVGGIIPILVLIWSLRKIRDKINEQARMFTDTVNSSTKRLEVILSTREFKVHLTFCLAILFTVIANILVDFSFDLTHSNSLQLLSYYFKLPLYVVVSFATINLCYIVASLSQL